METTNNEILLNIKELLEKLETEESYNLEVFKKNALNDIRKLTD